MTNAFRVNRIVLLWLTLALGTLVGNLPARADCKPAAKHDCCATAKAVCHCLSTSPIGGGAGGHLSCACQTAPDDGSSVPASVEKVFALDAPVLLTAPLVFAARPTRQNVLFASPVVLARPPNLDTSAPPRAPPFPA